MIRQHALVFGLLTWSACATLQDLEKQQAQVEALQNRLALEGEQARQERLALRQTLEESTTLLGQNSADSGAQLERTTVRLNRVEGGLEELERKLQALADQLAVLDQRVTAAGPQDATTGAAVTPPAEPDPPATAEDLQRLAEAKLAAGAHGPARELLRALITRFPKDKRASGAQLKLGESYYAEGRFGPAVTEYRKVLEQHRNSAEVPDALYKIGMSFYQLKWCSDAEAALTELIKKYKTHRAARDAKRTLDLIKKYRNNRRFCTS